MRRPADQTAWPDLCWAYSAAVAAQAPLVHNITNRVVLSETAAAIAALGATQLTLENVEEATEVAAASQALALNLGTPDDNWSRCADAALSTAATRGIPWVLDPVAAGVFGYRTRLAHWLLARQPSVLRANASEILALGGAAASGRGGDSAHAVHEAAEVAWQLARTHGSVVVVTGAEDLVTDGTRAVWLANGDPLMGRAVATGCMLTSVIACFLAVERANPFEAAVAAVAHFTAAGERAAANAEGPGSFRVRLIDALYQLNAATLAESLSIRSA